MPTRDEVLAAHGERCHICTAPLDDDWHREHVIALVDGGSNHITNVKPACARCNLIKSYIAYIPRPRHLDGYRTRHPGRITLL